jgi:hypothetical protein
MAEGSGKVQEGAQCFEIPPGYCQKRSRLLAKAMESRTYFMTTYR